MSQHGAHASVRHRGTPRGFTLVEAVVAGALVVTTVAICLPALQLVRQAVDVSSRQALASIVAASRLEELHALAWHFETPAPGLEVRVSDLTTDLSVAPAAGGGNGLQQSPADALVTNRDGYVDFLDGQGRWLGGGVSPPPNSVFVRRWSVTRWPPAPDDVLVLQVMVGALAVEPGAAGRAGLGRRPGDAWLLSVRTRRRR
jgi:type II secretory pathway pseudopilin PulG